MIWRSTFVKGVGVSDYGRMNVNTGHGASESDGELDRGLVLREIYFRDLS